jgi:hypothetical protein
MALRQTFRMPLRLMLWLLLVMAVTTQGAAASARPPSYGGTAVINNAGFSAAASLPAASTVAGNYQYAFVDYAGTGN